MKKLFCMIALAAVTFGNVYAGVAVHHTKTTMQTDTTKKSKKSKKMNDTGSMKKDTTKKL